MQLWGYSLTNAMINKLRISNTVCTSHRILLEHLGPNQETTDTGFPALNKVRTYALRIAGLGIYVSHTTRKRQIQYLCTVLTTVSGRKYLAQPTETTGKKIILSPESFKYSYISMKPETRAENLLYSMRLQYD